MSTVPGVTAAAVSTNATPPQSGSAMDFQILGQPALGKPTALMQLVGPKYFGALKIPVVEGRMWSAAENHDGAKLAVVNESFARAYFPKGDVLGHSLKLPEEQARPPIVLTAPHLAQSWLQIVGVVGDSRDDGLRNPVKPAVFVPWTLSIPAGTQFLVKTTAPPLRLMHAVRAALAEVNPEQQAARVVSDLDKWISDQPEWQQEHLVAWLFAAFAVLALSLAAVGLYSVVSYTVTQRTNEFGIRMALGAQRGHLLRLVFASTAASVVGGVLAGLALTLGLNGVMGRWMGGSVRDPLLLPTGALILGLVAAVACGLPAWRAARVDPMTALRME